MRLSLALLLLSGLAQAQPRPTAPPAVPDSAAVTGEALATWLDLVCSEEFTARSFEAFPATEVAALHGLLADPTKGRCWNTAARTVGLVGGPQNGAKLARFITHGHAGEIHPPMYRGLTFGPIIGLGLLIRRFPGHASTPGLVELLGKSVDPATSPARQWTSKRFSERGVRRFIARSAVMALILSSHPLARERLVLLGQQTHLLEVVGRHMAQRAVERFDLRKTTPIDQKPPRLRRGAVQ